MDKQALNRKIAEFFGFVRKKYRSPVCKHEPRCEYWVTPDGKHYRSALLPDFTGSLDALFKWAFQEGITLLQFQQYSYELICLIYFQNEWYAGKAGKKEEALALCLAIEKLIDARGK